MKKTLLCSFLLVCFIGFSKNPPVKATSNPAIGIKMSSQYLPGLPEIQLSFTVKNIGEETINSIEVSLNPQVSSAGVINNVYIMTMAPGEESITYNITKFGSDPCFDITQLIVQGWAENNVQVGDLSADIYGFDNNQLPGSYYNDIVNFTSNFVPQLNALQNGVYQDSNNNNIVDIGDVVNYTYNLQFFGVSISGEIIDNNAVIASPFFFNDGTLMMYSTTGIHYLTQADVDLGYVYNSSFVSAPQSCVGSNVFQDESYCGGCPNPSGSNIITKLTSLLPNKISGSVKFNVNNDCNTALNFPNRRVNTTDGTYNYATYTNAVGNFNILIPNSGSYDTSALSSLGANFSSNPASVLTNSSGENIDYNNNDFCISSSTNYADLRVNLFNVNQAIPGFSATYRLYYENIGTTNLNGTIVLSYDNSILNSLNAVPAENASTANTLTWNYTDLLPFERRYIELSSMVFIPPAVVSGDINTMTLTGNPIAGDNNPANNTFVLNQTVVSSFDPNDKTVLEGEVITANQATGYLNYVTRFQNTGTANATTVVVKETLDADLDWNTFEPIDASHTNNIQIRNGNELTYTFSNIDLAFESANEPASHGWLAYRIKPKSTFDINDVATSNSAIYFDFNPPILTNEVNTAIEVLATSGFTKNQFVIYPNPAKNFITIESKSNLIAQYEILTTNGQSLIKNTIENNKLIDISALQNGFYFITLKTSEGNATYKFIKN